METLESDYFIFVFVYLHTPRKQSASKSAFFLDTSSSEWELQMRYSFGINAMHMQSNIFTQTEFEAVIRSGFVSIGACKHTYC